MPTIVTAHISAHSEVVERDAKEMRNTQDTRTGFVSCKSGRLYLFLVEKMRRFQQRKNNFYLPRRSNRTFYSQTEVNSKTSKVCFKMLSLELGY